MNEENVRKEEFRVLTIVVEKVTPSGEAEKAAPTDE